MKHRIKLCCLLGLALTCSTVSMAADSYQELDNDIVKAYNRVPRNTGAVYAGSMRILEKAKVEKSPAAGPWELKARKLITVSCFYECTQAIDRKLYRDAYVWARRGEKSGTVIGKIGNTPVKELYDYLAFAGKELQSTPMVRNSEPHELETRINYVPDVTALIIRGWLVWGCLNQKHWNNHG